MTSDILNHIRRGQFFISVLSVAIICKFSTLHAAEPESQTQEVSSEFTDEQLEFFEKSVRPLLVSNCGNCHGEKKQWSGLRLDSRKFILTGGETGPAIVPGDPDASLLILAVRRTGDYEMPPEKPLSAEQVSILEQWVKMGAPWPKEEGPPGDSLKKRWAEHWAFQPRTVVVPPAVSNVEQCRTPVDKFVISKLSEASLTLSPPADRGTLIRRLSYDLTGLPPSMEQVQKFKNDPDPQAYEKLVEHLLASPQYGEHWGRKWLDLARYADTKGYMFGWEISRFVHSSTYRDWVITSFNNDLPYNQFLELQLAADQIAPEKPAAQAAMGFLTVGRRFLGNNHDVIDDRIDTITRTTMGLTVACARCHDHKYDPIPTADYYALYGVLNNSIEQLTPACNLQAEATPEFVAELSKLQHLFDEAKLKLRNTVADRMRSRIQDYLIAQLNPDEHPNIPFSQLLAVGDLFPVYVERLHAFVAQECEKNDPVFTPWKLFAKIPSEDFVLHASEVSQKLQTLSSHEANPLVTKHFETAPQTMVEVAERYGRLLKEVHEEWQSELKRAQDSGGVVPDKLSDASREQIRQVLYGPSSPCLVPDEHLVRIGTYFATRSELVEIWKFQTNIENFILDSAKAPPFTVRIVDRPSKEIARIFRRGNPMTKGDEVSLHFPQVVAGENSPPFQIGSGRMELARGIAAADNPLTARVWVNRLWQHHFGTGIVATPSDFGVRAPRPEHLELLDWLAQKLVDESWSTKAIHREIVLSSTYRQSGSGPDDPAVRKFAMETDPENHLLWKKDAHRLTFEEFRDSLFAVTGELDLQTGGPGVPLFTGPDEPRRRTIYGFIDRGNLPNVYRIFDFANPDLHIPVRSETTVSQQALFAMNHPMVANRARALALRFEDDEGRPMEARVADLFVQIFQRNPTSAELQTATEFLKSDSEPSATQPTPEQLAWQYGYGRVDSSKGQVLDFKPIPFFTGSAWQGGTKWPDSQLGWAQLTATGGHPGNTNDYAVVRRWIAPAELRISIESDFRHEVDKGNGVRGWIVSSRRGILNQFRLHNNRQATSLSGLTVMPGESIDFVVDIDGELGYDQFLWNVTLQSHETDAAGKQSSRTWNSERDFHGPNEQMLTDWAQLAQVLLLSNEFLFVE